MSFILDALRRADAERERGQLPDLHARSLSARATPEAHVEDTPWLRIAAVATALLLAGLLAWLLLRAEAPPSAQTPAPPEMPAPRPEVAVSPPVAPATPAPAPVARAEVPVPRVAPPPLARTAPAKAAAPMASSVAPTTTATTATTTATTAATPTPAPRPAQPPAATVPALKVGGVMYAETPENRVLVINDQVLREGETVQPGLVLEHIGPKSARLRWKDQVVEVPY